MKRLGINLVLAMVAIAWGATIALAQTDVLVVDGTKVGIIHSIPGGGTQPVATATHTLAQVRDQFGNAIPSLHLASQSSPPPTIDSFFDVWTELAPGGNWAVDSFFDITYRIGPVGDPPLLDRDAPVMTMRMTSQQIPEPASAALVCLGGILLLSRRRRS